MKRTIPLLITALGGIVLVVAFFIPAFESWGEQASIWFDILAAIAFILGGGNLFKVHLQTISDRKKGWGFSAVTLGVFLLMLFLGLFKIGSQPSPSTEFHGESVVHFPLEWMPLYSTSGQLRSSAASAPIPSAVQRQLQIADGELRFRGWVDGSQSEALDRLDDELAWRCSCEKLSNVAQPPEALQGKVRQLADHGILAYKVVMTPQEQQLLASLFSQEPQAVASINKLAEASRRKYRIEVTPPLSFQVPENLSEVVHITESGIELTGPLSKKDASLLARDACHYPLARWMPESERTILIQQIESQGPALSDPQRKALARYFKSIPTMDVLILQLEKLVPPQTVKTSCELLDEWRAGNNDLQRKSDTPIEPVTEEQREALRRFGIEPQMSAEELMETLKSGGMNPLRIEAVNSWLAKLPTQGDRNKEICIELLKAGPVALSQREWLLKGARDQYAWRRAVGDLYVRAHTNLYPWSGDYAESGTPFDWMYLWILQPLMTTTFALLAFYVASAAFRAFRAKNLEATLLLGTALIILFRATMIAPAVHVPLPDGSQLDMDRIYGFVMRVFNTAGNRAIMIGIALGIASTSLKVLLGIDRSYLGSDD